jgi:anthranilate synthase component 1
MPARAGSAGHVRLALDDSPDLIALHEARPARYPHLLQSVSRGTPRARYDILFAFPGTMLVADSDGRLHQDGQRLADSGFLPVFDRLWRQSARRAFPASPDDSPPPFTGGWFVFLGYELASEIEPVLGHIPRDSHLPRASATYFPAAIVRDHTTRQTYFMCEEEQASRLFPAMQADLRRPAGTPEDEPIELGALAEDDPRRFLDNVRCIQEYIRAGDVFQVNISRSWRATLSRPVSSATLYRRLCAANPAPFAGIVTFPGNRAIISSSPERLVEVRGALLRTRPIAGTYPRSADAVQDRAWSRELLLHPKERAEHVMLIDLERNDLGRVCRPGSVRVPEFMVLESYRHVHHIVSEVRGELRPGTSPAQVVRAVFPGGTITGCPKVRCMQIIAERERDARGAYTGSVGYINSDGSMDFNILIRTLVRRGDEVYARAGAGVVADSVPERELEETRAKAKGLLAALSPG